MEKRGRKEDDSIVLAMGLTKEWEDQNQEEVKKAFDAHERVSDSLIEHIMNIRREEFGDVAYEPTAYEKKLLFSGFEFAKILIASKQAHECMEGMMKSSLLSSMLGMPGGVPGMPGMGGMFSGMMGMPGMGMMRGKISGKDMEELLEILKRLGMKNEEGSDEDQK